MGRNFDHSVSDAPCIDRRSSPAVLVARRCVGRSEGPNIGLLGPGMDVGLDVPGDQIPPTHRGRRGRAAFC